jgi:mannose-6-phosphate isomerase-like protein (cupin superfamily)
MARRRDGKASRVTVPIANSQKPIADSPYGGHMTAESDQFATAQLRKTHDVLAPDGSEIRILVATRRGSMAHGTLHPGQVSRAIVHREVDEIWFVTAGQGEIWRKLGDDEQVTPVGPGSALSIPVGTHFQFRATGAEPFCFVMCTMPPWPGAHEAIPVSGRWDASA